MAVAATARALRRTLPTPPLCARASISTRAARARTPTEARTPAASRRAPPRPPPARRFLPSDPKPQITDFKLSTLHLGPFIVKHYPQRLRPHSPPLRTEMRPSPGTRRPNHLPSLQALHLEPRTLNPHPSTLDPQPQPSIPKPSNQPPPPSPLGARLTMGGARIGEPARANPYARYHAPFTLNPEPCTLHSAPSILKTLNSKPYTVYARGAMPFTPHPPNPQPRTQRNVPVHQGACTISLKWLIGSYSLPQGPRTCVGPPGGQI